MLVSARKVQLSFKKLCFRILVTTTAMLINRNQIVKKNDVSPRISAVTASCTKPLIKNVVMSEIDTGKTLFTGLKMNFAR